jgi:hypothetical protein
VHRFSSLLLCLWLGAFLAVGALFAPAIFDAAETSSQAGLIAGTVFERLNIAGIYFAITVLCMQRPIAGLVGTLLGLIVLLIVVSQYVVTPKIELFRELSGRMPSSGTVEYQAFWKWHGISNLLFFTEAIIVAAVLCLKFKENQS